MKTTNSIVSRTAKQPRLAQKSGEPNSLQSKRPKSCVETEISSGPKKLLLTREMAAERLGCHWQTVIYREKKGDLTGIRIGRRKYYNLEQVEKLIRSNPVHSKPHWSKRTTQTNTPTKPTLWNRIKNAIASFVK